MRACTFGRTATISRIRGNGIRLNAVESASASVAIGAMTLTVRYSEGLRPVAGSNRWTSSAQPPRTCSPTILRAFWPKRPTAHDRDAVIAELRNAGFVNVAAETLTRRSVAPSRRDLLYTGVTRGKKLVVLVGQKKAVAIAVRSISGRRRWSKLREWLAEPKG